MDSEVSSHTHEWKFFDFEGNWNRFWEIWQSDEIQEILRPDMQRWCDQEAYYDRLPNGRLVKPTWKAKDDLWRYSKTDFHSQRILDKVNYHVESDNCIAKFIDAKRRFGMTYASEDLQNEAFWSICGNALEEMFEPKKGSWEAQILIMGANFLTSALKYTAIRMFPEEQVKTIYIKNSKGTTVILPRLKIIFDLVRAFHHMESCAETPDDIMSAYHEIFMDEEDIEYIDDSSIESDFDINSSYHDTDDVHDAEIAHVFI